MQMAKRKHIPIYLAKVAQYLCRKMALKEEMINQKEPRKEKSDKHCFMGKLWLVIHTLRVWGKVNGSWETTRTHKVSVMEVRMIR